VVVVGSSVVPPGGVVVVVVVVVVGGAGVVGAGVVGAGVVGPPPAVVVAHHFTVSCTGTVTGLFVPVPDVMTISAT
jgi:hypothetical protein